LDTSDSNTTHHIKDLGLDAQYQYLLDPHSVTAQAAYMKTHHRYPGFLAGQAPDAGFVDASGNALPNTNESDTVNVLRTKLTYVYRAKYGGSLGFFNLTGSTNTANQTSGFDGTGAVTLAPDVSRVNANFTGDPATRGWTYEAFWTPIQYMRVGVQYTTYSRFNGASNNYDGLGRNARDNNSLFLYVWAAY
jgi:hypothetical protein